MTYSAEERKYIIGPYRMLADKCGVSEVTMRNALARRPITYQTACRIGRHLGIDPVCFRIKSDSRGCRNGTFLKRLSDVEARKSASRRG